MSLDWQSRARCKDQSTDIFFPTRQGSITHAACREAKAICACCPVVRDCLAYAMSFNRAHRMFGIWGGTSDQDRRAMPKRCLKCRAFLSPEEVADHHLAGTPGGWWCRRCGAMPAPTTVVLRARAASLRLKRMWKPEYLRKAAHG